jgi:hypothetical protein
VKSNNRFDNRQKSVAVLSNCKGPHTCEIFIYLKPESHTEGENLAKTPSLAPTRRYVCRRNFKGTKESHRANEI